MTRESVMVDLQLKVFWAWGGAGEGCQLSPQLGAPRCVQPPLLAV